MSDVIVVKRRGGSCLVILLFLFLGTLVLLMTIRGLGYVEPLYVPQADMAPTVSQGDHVLVEQFTYKSHPPQRGDVVEFRINEKSVRIDPGIYVLRIVGMPGETIRLTEEGITIQDKPVLLHNVLGKIKYAPLPEATFLTPEHDTILVPKDSFFLMGDNTNGSVDGRFWGFLPTKQVMGKVVARFWPLNRAGLVE